MSNAKKINVKIKDIVHPKMKLLTSFTYPHVVPNLYEVPSYVEHKSRYFEECWCFCGSVVEHYVSRQTVVGSIPREHTY